MKVVHLTYDDIYGAGKAAVRISRALSSLGIDSTVYTQKNALESDASLIHMGVADQISNILHIKQGEIRVNHYPQHGYFHSVDNGLALEKKDFIKTADIIHLHWVNYGIFSSKLIKSLSSMNKPVVWTMHDMWPFTGGCHCDQFCKKYKSHCGCCPVLKSKLSKDLSSKSLNIKSKLYSRSNISFVGPSSWITSEASSSIALLNSNCRCVHIGNPAPSHIFQPRNQSTCKNILGIHTQKKIISFGAVNALSDKNKGFDLLKKALSYLDNTKYCLLVFGNNQSEIFNDFEVYYTGYISDELHLSFIYNASDIFVAPSRQDNLPTTVMEALSCGVPVVAFHIGGMPDLIHPNKNGYLAAAYNPKDLAAGIEKTVSADYSREKISTALRSDYSSEKIGKSYLDLYKHVSNKID